MTVYGSTHPPIDRPPTYDGEFGDGQARQIRRCSAYEEHVRLLRRDPAYRARRREIGREIAAWIARYGDAGLRTGLIRIPVVVHVVYNTAAQNISDAQIHSQIDVLNRDYRRLNTDAVNTPAAFAGVAADARIEFALAVRDPNCGATTGITRTHTSVVDWSEGEDTMKSAATGGADQWDPDQYLNFWIVNYTGGLLGYGTFPGMPANIEGVVVDYRAFGTVGTLTPGANLGRTASHEVGHYPRRRQRHHLRQLRQHHLLRHPHRPRQQLCRHRVQIKLWTVCRSNLVRDMLSEHLLG